MQERLRELVELLDLEPIDRDIFRGRNESQREGRLFGGQVAAQALAAAGRTVEERTPHSLHAYFLRAGDPARPVVYSVDRIRDGRSFATRRVVAIQNGHAIFNMSISFQMNESGYEHQIPMPEAPDPEGLPSWNDQISETSRRAGFEKWASDPRPIDMRFAVTPTFLGGGTSSEPNLVWMRSVAPLPEDPFLHQCVLTYASDMSLLDNIVRPHGRNGALGPVMMASLDHALWFHEPVRMDQWLLYAQESTVAARGRGFARGTIFQRDGRLVASVAQEGLLRPVKRPEDRSH